MLILDYTCNKTRKGYERKSKRVKYSLKSVKTLKTRGSTSSDVLHLCYYCKLGRSVVVLFLPLTGLSTIRSKCNKMYVDFPLVAHMVEKVIKLSLSSSSSINFLHCDLSPRPLDHLKPNVVWIVLQRWYRLFR